jgi:hypothetical protein
VSESNKFKLLEDRIRKILKDSKNQLTLSDRLSLLYNLMSIAKLAKIPSGKFE